MISMIIIMMNIIIFIISIIIIIYYNFSMSYLETVVRHYGSKENILKEKAFVQDWMDRLVATWSVLD